MRVSREQMAENRKRILDEAGELFRAKGFDAVSVAEVMKAAGLTHGGFYGHFGSKDDLIACALAHGFSTTSRPPVDMAAYLATYLSPEHRQDVAGGCLISALVADTLRQTPEARAAMTEGIRAQIERLSQAQPDADPADRRRAAIGCWAAMVGAMILARASEDDALADEILAQTRAWIEARGTEPDGFL